MPPRRVGNRIAHGLFMTAFLAFWTLIFSIISRALIDGFSTGHWAMPWFLLISLWLILFGGEICGIAQFIAAVMPPFPEKVRMGREVLVHDEGYSAGRTSPGKTVSFIFRRLRGGFREYPRELLSEPRLERIDGNPWLFMDHGCERIWIGRDLSEQEKEWLFELLCGWKRA